MELIYRTTMSINYCIESITSSPQIYKCMLGTEMWYECKRVSDTQMLVTFKGGQFHKMCRTQYLMTFVENGETTVILKFCKEMFGFFLPMTSSNDIDCFMKEKICAVRKT